MLVSLCRPRPCVHSLPTSCDPSAMASGLVHVLLLHDHHVRNRRTGQLQPTLCLPKMSCNISSFVVSKLTFFPVILQFAGLESIMTSLTDIYPSQIRKGYRRELILMLICAVCYAFDLLLVSEVSCKKYIHWWSCKQFIM